MKKKCIALLLFVLGLATGCTTVPPDKEGDPPRTVVLVSQF
jgi:hypothetical protein